MNPFNIFVYFEMAVVAGIFMLLTAIGLKVVSFILRLICADN